MTSCPTTHKFAQVAFLTAVFGGALYLLFNYVSFRIKGAWNILTLRSVTIVTWWQEMDCFRESGHARTQLTHKHTRTHTHTQTHTDTHTHTHAHAHRHINTHKHTHTHTHTHKHTHTHTHAHVHTHTHTHTHTQTNTHTHTYTHTRIHKVWRRPTRYVQSACQNDPRKRAQLGSLPQGNRAILSSSVSPEDSAINL